MAVSYSSELIGESITVAAGGTDRVLLVGLWSYGGAASTAVSYASVSMTLETTASYNSVYLTLWSLKNPTVGTATLSITGGADNRMVMSLLATGTHGTSPVRNAGSGQGSALSVTSSVTSQTSDVVFAFGMYVYRTGSSETTQITGTDLLADTVSWEESSGDPEVPGDTVTAMAEASYIAGSSGSTSMVLSISSCSPIAALIVAVSIRPPAGATTRSVVVSS